MKRLFILLLLLFAVYAAKPYWESYASEYVDLSFLDPVDDTIENVVTSEPFEKSVLYISNKIDQAFHFLLGDKNQVAPVNAPELEQPNDNQISIHNIDIGMPKTEVIQKLGEPIKTSLSEYGERWSIYHQDYHNFMMISYDESGNVSALYTNDNLIASNTGLQYNALKADVRAAYGEPLTEIRKGLNVFMLQNSEEFDLFEVNDLYLYVFYDLHRNDQVTAIQIVSKALEQQKERLYAPANEALRNGFEAQLFELTNASRVRHGISPLQLDERVSNTARNHSIDMAKNDYFNHENLQGLSPFERMKADHITFRSAGENLAYGQSSSIFAHEGLMNSLGHRENILLDNYSHLGVGVAFNEESQPYYTTKFLLK